jgi:hypothetical protein
MHVTSAFPPTVLWMVTCVGIIGLAPTVGNAQTARIEVHPLQTMTLTDKPFLTGAKDSKPVVIAGELCIPRPGTDRLPAVVFVHGSGGVGASVAHLIHEARINEGAVPVGRKIGFTNPAMWSLYGVREPIWAYVYDTTVVRILLVILQVPKIMPRTCFR